MLWVPITIAAAVSQVLRNGAQASLTEKIGTLGATQVRFIFGFPFAVLFFVVSLVMSGQAAPPVNASSLTWSALGAVSQIAATALMLTVMRRRAFGVAYAYLKTEPVIVAVMGVAFIGESLPPLGWLSVFVVTSGVLLASVHPRDVRKLASERTMIAAGLTSGVLFGLSAIAFRAAIESLPAGNFVVRSMATLVITLLIQCLFLGLWLAWRDRRAFIASLSEWRRSAAAGLLGATASACWFCAFALTPAANVRTLGLIEMPLAALLSRRLTGRKLAGHQMVAIAVVTIGILTLVTEAVHAPV